VTKGLNPNAPMKDSGVEWLGDVPEHWTVLKNRHIFNFSKGLSITKENLQESGIPCVSYGEVHSKFGFEFNPEINDMKFVSEEYLKTSKNCLLNSGDFIFADTSEDFEGSGNFSYLNSNSQVFAGYHTVIARLKSKQKPRFFAYIFDSNAHRKQIQTQVKGIKVFSITQGILKDIYSWLPPVHEQDLIVEYLDNECKKISLLKAKQIELIEKLKAYRSSIISHAVTGKIDVREFGA
jgi:type I restriction enzyme S subunit